MVRWNILLYSKHQVSVFFQRRRWTPRECGSNRWWTSPGYVCSGQILLEDNLTLLLFVMLFLFHRLKQLSVLLKTREIASWKVSSPNRNPDRSWRVWRLWLCIWTPSSLLSTSSFNHVLLFFNLEQYQKVMHDQMNLNNEKTHLENQFKNLQQRLEITTELYQQKENALQQWDHTHYSHCTQRLFCKIRFFTSVQIISNLKIGLFHFDAKTKQNNSGWMFRHGSNLCFPCQQSLRPLFIRIAVVKKWFGYKLTTPVFPRFMNFLCAQEIDSGGAGETWEGDEAVGGGQ